MGRFLRIVGCSCWFLFLISSDGYPQESTETNRAVADSAQAPQDDALGVDITAAAAFAETLRKELLSDEVVYVPKKYIYGLVSFLVLMMVLVQFSRRSSAGKRGMRKRQNQGLQEPVIRRNDIGFTNYVLSLFDPHLFDVHSYERAGHRSAAQWFPSLQGEFSKDDAKYAFGLEVLYLQKVTGGKVVELTPEMIHRYRAFEAVHGDDLYLVIGIEGEPSFPKEIYLLDTSRLKPGTIGYEDIQPFRKYGLFFFHPGAGKLQ